MRKILGIINIITCAFMTLWLVRVFVARFLPSDFPLEPTTGVIFATGLIAFFFGAISSIAGLMTLKGKWRTIAFVNLVPVMLFLLILVLLVFSYG